MTAFYRETGMQEKCHTCSYAYTTLITVLLKWWLAFEFAVEYDPTSSALLVFACLQHAKAQPEIAEMPESPKAAPPAPAASGAKEIPRVPKNDAPNRFWSMVEPYCREIASEDLKVLEDLMKSHEDEGDFYKIPPLGKHYSQKWAHEDMLEEQREGGKIDYTASV